MINANSDVPVLILAKYLTKSEPSEPVVIPA